MPECRQTKSNQQGLGEEPLSRAELSRRLKEVPPTPSVMTYASINLTPAGPSKVPTVAPCRRGPSISKKEYRALIETPEMQQRHRKRLDTKKAARRTDNRPSQYSMIRFAEEDTVVTFGPRLACIGNNGCCRKRRHICHKGDTWLSRPELRAIARQRSIDIKLYAPGWGDDIEEV